MENPGGKPATAAASCVSFFKSSLQEKRAPVASRELCIWARSKNRFMVPNPAFISREPVPFCRSTSPPGAKEAVPDNAIDSGGLSLRITSPLREIFRGSRKDGIETSACKPLIRVVLLRRSSIKEKLPSSTRAFRKRSGRVTAEDFDAFFGDTACAGVPSSSLTVVLPSLSLVTVTSIPLISRVTISSLPDRSDDHDKSSFRSERFIKGLWSLLTLLKLETASPSPQEKDIAPIETGFLSSCVK